VASVAILDYGMGNLRSVSRAVARVGGRPAVTSDPAEAARADAVVVPGVGAFGACMRGLEQTGLDAVVREFASSERPVLGVCLGMQVLFEASEEDPDPGLGLLPGAVRRLPAGPGVKVPHMGWNEVRWTSDHPITRGIPSGTRFYFVHSYAPDPAAGLTIGETEHGRPFSAVVARGSLFATQFHPERSGDAGLALYEAFVKEIGT
jgi:glutamine amidotransferase